MIGTTNYVHDEVGNLISIRVLSGTILLNGPDSVLHLWSDNRFDVDEVDESGVDTITGILNDQTNVSLIECVNIGGGDYFGHDGVSHHKKFFPHYVIIGPRYFSHSEKVISKISFLVDDAETLFHDLRSFGTITVAPENLEELSKTEIFSKIPFSKEIRPHIAYYTGKYKIFSANTVLGKITARNSPTFGMGGPSGVCMENKIYVDINLNEPISITQIYYPLRKVLRFFEVIVGRPQKILEVKVFDNQKNVKPIDSSTVYINMYPNREVKDEGRGPDFRDILIDGSRNPRKFGTIIRAWLERDETWLIARERFSEGWKQQTNYDGDRVVRAANMFDLLPNGALPENQPLPNELASAVSATQDCFKMLEKSPERESILNALGRIKQLSLKQKIRYRSSILTNVIGDHISDIDAVTNAAVDLRNLYVHGGAGYTEKKKQNLRNNHVFLTDTLEFVFCASDLVELGWDIKAWGLKLKLTGHPFYRYLRDYKTNLSELMGC